MVLPGKHVQVLKSILQVVSAKANFVAVKVSPEEGPAVELLCIVRALLKKIKQRVLVGDRVRVVSIDWPALRGVIADISTSQHLNSNSSSNACVQRHGGGCGAAQGRAGRPSGGKRGQRAGCLLHGRPSMGWTDGHSVPGLCRAGADSCLHRAQQSRPGHARAGCSHGCRGGLCC